jgi:hypothetical protein
MLYQPILLNQLIYVTNIYILLLLTKIKYQ